MSILIMVVVQGSCVYIQYPISKTPCVGEAVYIYVRTPSGPRPPHLSKPAQERHICDACIAQVDLYRLPDFT